MLSPTKGNLEQWTVTILAHVFQLPTKILFGIGSINELGREALEFNAKKVLVITDPGVVKAELHKGIIESLNRSRIEVQVFAEVESDPSIATAAKAAELAKEFCADVIVAIGGGSVLDAAKSAALLVTNSGNLKDFAGVNKVKYPGIPVIAVPTTAGTGSEVTIFAVMSDSANNEKFTISSPLIAPRVAVLDPALTLTLPRGITASTGMDALTHAIEAYTSTNAQPATDGLALQAIELISKNLRVAVWRGDNIQARGNMLQASLLAGIAFNNAFLGLSHAIASPLGAHFHIAHGIANAVMLPYVMEYNSVTAADKLAVVARLMDVNDKELNTRSLARQAVTAVEELCNDIGIPNRLRDIGAKEDLLHVVARDALKSVQLKFNTRGANETDILALLKKAF